MKCRYCPTELIPVMQPDPNRIYVCNKCAAKSCEPTRGQQDLSRELRIETGSQRWNGNDDFDYGGRKP